MRIRYVWDVNKALEHGPFAWPGGYPCYFVTSDGCALSFESVKENAGLVRDAVISHDMHSGWDVIALEVNWEDAELICAHSGARIQSAYGDDEESASREHCDICGKQHEESDRIGACDDCLNKQGE